MTVRFVGVDLAWAQRTDGRPDNETGLVALDRAGRVLDAGWRRGVAAAAAWIDAQRGPGGTAVFVDASLVVDNDTGQRWCERQVGQRYGAWKVSANTTNRHSPHRAGEALLARLEASGWRYDSGLAGPPAGGLTVSECYPYTTLVGTPALYAGERERPRYKRKPPGMPAAVWQPLRAANFDELVRRLAALDDPPLRLGTHPVTAQLVTEPAPLQEAAYKHREDLLDAAVAAWTALLWHRYGTARCQVLGPPVPPGRAPTGREPTIIAPATPAQRRPPAVLPGYRPPSRR